MRVFILILLTLFLALLVFLKLELNDANKASNEIKQEYFTQEYIIKDIDDSGYYGQAENGKNIYFKKEYISPGLTLQIEDIVIVYYEKGKRIDGLIKVEKK